MERTVCGKKKDKLFINFLPLTGTADLCFNSSNTSLIALSQWQKLSFGRNDLPRTKSAQVVIWQRAFRSFPAQIYVSFTSLSFKLCEGNAVKEDWTGRWNIWEHIGEVSRDAEVEAPTWLLPQVLWKTDFFFIPLLNFYRNQSDQIISLWQFPVNISPYCLQLLLLCSSQWLKYSNSGVSTAPVCDG